MLRYSNQIVHRYFLKSLLPIAFFALASLAMTQPLTGQGIEPFTILGTASEKLEVEPDPQSKLTVLYFTGIECPLAKLYAPQVAELAEAYKPKSVRFIGINSNQQDSMEEFTEFVADSNFKFPCGKDFNNIAADQLSVIRTPEVIVLDSKFEIQYRGRIDDQYEPGVSRKKPNRLDLKIALNELLAGKNVSQPQTKPAGCLLGRVKKVDETSEVNFANQISRVFQRNCVECHRSGDIGPFVLDDYEEAIGWADMIVETIDDGRMPPWHADPAHGKFVNARTMSEEDKQLVRKWVAAGAPLGDAQDLPPKQNFVAGWHLSKEPDLVLSMSESPYVIPATGTVDYQYFVVDPKFETDKWILEAQVVPGTRSVVHHSIVFIRPPDGGDFLGVGWLGSYVPGQKNVKLDPTRARFVPAGSKLVFQQHYTPNGTEQTDTSKVALVFADETQITNELVTLMAIDQQFEIKPHDPSHKVTTKLNWLPPEGMLLSVSPHMHFRGKSYKASLKNAAGEETFLSVPNYDFNWQHSYQLAEPISLKEVESITAEVTFDNSVDNPFNPDPTRHVTWGDQTWEEMAVGFFDVSLPRSFRTDLRSGKQGARRSQNLNAQTETKPVNPALDAKVESFVNEFFDRFDANKNGIVERQELPLSTRGWSYDKFQTDKEPGLSREEIAKQARRRFK